MISEAIRHTRLRGLLLWSVILVITTWAPTTLAQDRPLQPVVEGKLAPGVSHTYAVTAKAGDMVFATLELHGADTHARVMVELLEANGSRIKESPVYGYQTTTVPLGLVTPSNGRYRLAI